MQLPFDGLSGWLLCVRDCDANTNVFLDFQLNKPISTIQETLTNLPWKKDILGVCMKRC